MRLFFRLSMPFSLANFSHLVSTFGFGSGFSRGIVSDGSGSFASGPMSDISRGRSKIWLISSCTFSRACSASSFSLLYVNGCVSKAARLPRSYTRSSSFFTSLDVSIAYAAGAISDAFTAILSMCLCLCVHVWTDRERRARLLARLGS